MRALKIILLVVVGAPVVLFLMLLALGVIYQLIVANSDNQNVVGADNEYSKSVLTALGQISVVSTGEAEKLSLPGYEFTVEDASVSIRGKIQSGDNEYVLVQTSSAGTACPALFVVIIVSSQSAEVTDPLGDCSDYVKMTSMKTGVEVWAGQERYHVFPGRHVHVGTFSAQLESMVEGKSSQTTKESHAAQLVERSKVCSFGFLSSVRIVEGVVEYKLDASGEYMDTLARKILERAYEIADGCGEAEVLAVTLVVSGLHDRFGNPVDDKSLVIKLDLSEARKFRSSTIYMYDDASRAGVIVPIAMSPIGRFIRN